MRLPAAAALALLLVAAGPYKPIEGTWKIDRLEPAPWVDKDNIPDVPTEKTYLNTTVVFESKRIKATGLLACSKPNYRYNDVPPEGMFQGGLDDGKGVTGHAASQAKGLGFTSPTVHTVTTDCEHDIAFHMTDSNHAAFALDNIIFWMTRQP